MLKRIWAVIYARNLEYFRDKSALGWNVIFPVLVVFGFAAAFSGSSRGLYKVGVLGEGSDAPFFETKYIEFVEVKDEQEAINKVRRHQFDLLYRPDSKQYWTNQSSPKGYIVEKLLLGSESDLRREAVDGDEIRYVDWLIAGLLSMNIMFSALFGVGYVIVRYRKNGVLKRLKATPLRPFEFLTAQVASRIGLLIVVNVAVFAGCDFFIQFQMLGSYWDLFVMMLLGTFCLITVGLLMATRTASEELAGGLLNLISWPMMFLSGVWFSVDGMNEWVQKLALALPLTHMIEGARSIMTEGATLVDCMPQILALTGMSALCLMAGALLFKWE